MENRYQKMKAQLDALNNEIEATQLEISKILLRLVVLAGFTNKMVKCESRIQRSYGNRYFKNDEKIVDIRFVATIGIADYASANEKIGIHAELGQVVEFIKSFFDVNNKAHKVVQLYEAALRADTGVVFELDGFLGKLYELSEMDDDSIKLLIEMRK